MKKQTSQNTPLSQPFQPHPNPLQFGEGARTKGVTTNVFFPSTRGGGIKGGGCKAFTLVELIVVITILAILGTIAFISLQGYSKDARDVKRISDVRSLLTKLNVEQSVGTPLNELITGTKTTLQILGEDDENVYTMGHINFQNINEKQEDFQDPSNNKDYYFAYAKGGTNTGAYNFIQGATISETQNTTKILGNYYTNTPGDALSLFMTGGTYYVEGDTSIYDVNEGNNNNNNNNNNNGGTTPPPAEENIEDMTTEEILTQSPDIEYNDQLPSNACAGCKDILIGDGTGSGYVIMDRNLGATAAYNGETEPKTLTTIPAYRGEHYQWGRDIGFAIASGQPNTPQQPITPATRNTDTNFIWNNPLTRYDWSTTQEDHLWGDTTTTIGTITNTTNQGPCPTGYHVPSTLEWDGLVKLWFQNNNGTCNASVGDSCTWGTETTLTKFKTDLKIPLAGYRGRNDGAVYYQGDNGNYWSSSPYGTNAHYLYFSSSYVFPQYNYRRANGFSVRCFKN